MELANVQKWAERNNLKLNCSKSTEVIFRDPRRRQHHVAATTEPVTLPGIERSSCLKMLRVSIENNFSIAQHVQRLVTASAQTVYALRVLRTRGLDDDAVQHVYRATVVARLTYTASAWRGLAKAPDRKRIDSVLSYVTSPTTNCSTKLGDCLNHVLHTLIPPQSSASQQYNLRHRTYSIQLPSRTTCLSDSNFIIRMLYKDKY